MWNGFRRFCGADLLSMKKKKTLLKEKKLSLIEWTIKESSLRHLFTNALQSFFKHPGIRKGKKYGAHCHFQALSVIFSSLSAHSSSTWSPGDTQSSVILSTTTCPFPSFFQVFFCRTYSAYRILLVRKEDYFQLQKMYFLLIQKKKIRLIIFAIRHIMLSLSILTASCNFANYWNWIFITPSYVIFLYGIPRWKVFIDAF